MSIDSISKRIVAARKRMGLTQEDVVEDITKKIAMYRLWEQGKREPDDGDLFQLADVLNVRYEWLKSGTGPMRSDEEGNPSIKVIGELPLVNSHEMYDGEVKEGILGMKRDGKLSHYLKYRFQRLSREEVEGGEDD